MNVRGILGFAVLFGAAVSSYYLTRSLHDTGIEVDATPTMQSGFYLRSARILGTGADGNLLYEVAAEYAEQRGDDLIEFQNVEISYSPDSGVPWRVAADSATIARDLQLLVLEGHVVARRTGGIGGRETEIRTPYLELEPERYRAETDHRVQVRIGSRSLTATGMLASLKDNELKLKSNVSGKFVP